MALPLTKARAEAVLSGGHDGYHSFNSQAKPYRAMLTEDEALRVMTYWRDEAHGSMSINDVLRKCAREGE